VTYDAVIVGGGIVGCACAYYLSFDLPRIALVEPGPIGGGATAAGMGHLVVMDDSEAQFALTRLSCDLWTGLAAELPKSAEYEQRGTLWVAADEEEMAEVHRKAAYYAERGVSTETLDQHGLAEAEPNLRASLAGALRVPGDAVVFPMPVAQWLLERSGAELIRGQVAAILPHEIVLSGDVSLSCHQIIASCGHHSADLIPGLPIQPRKGHLVITDRYPGFVNHQLVELGYLKSAHSFESDSVAFNVQPRATGQLLIGSSRQFAGTNPEIDRAIVSKMLARALEYMPGLAQLKAIRTWTGFRAATPDKLPLIGVWPDSPGVWIAAGHEGLGITTSLGTGKLISDLIAGRPSTLDPRPFDPSRGAHAHSH
jgi:glycine/D-amino acid oxidase-like deaminating enzyme